jgi:hypothetical protein
VVSGEDTRFDMPFVDDPPSTEVGVMLLGLDVRRLLAGLGLAALTDDPAAVALSVDHVRHGAPLRLDTQTLVAAGRSRWLAARAAIDEAARDLPGQASPRQAWPGAERAVGTVDPAATGPAVRAYLTACWLRGEEIDRVVEERT